MPVIRTSKEVWNFVMTMAIKTGEPVSIVVDKLLTEKMRDAKDSRGTKDGDKKRGDRGTEYCGVAGLSK
jgi:hypothetical protein